MKKIIIIAIFVFVFKQVYTQASKPYDHYKSSIGIVLYPSITSDFRFENNNAPNLKLGVFYETKKYGQFSFSTDIMYVSLKANYRTGRDCGFLGCLGDGNITKIYKNINTALSLKYNFLDKSKKVNTFIGAGIMPTISLKSEEIFYPNLGNIVHNYGYFRTYIGLTSGITFKIFNKIGVGFGPEFWLTPFRRIDRGTYDFGLKFALRYNI